MGKKEADSELDLLLQIKKSLDEKRKTYQDDQSRRQAAKEAEKERKKQKEAQKALAAKQKEKESKIEAKQSAKQEKISQQQKEQEAYQSQKLALAQQRAKDKEEKRIIREQERLERKEKRAVLLTELKTRIRGNLAYLGGIFTAISTRLAERREAEKNRKLLAEKAELVAAISEEIQFLKSKGIKVQQEERAIKKIAQSLPEANNG